MIRIVTDSTCDLPAELLAQHRISVVPINIQFGQESYQEGVTMTTAQFYRKVEELGVIPTTSQPSLGQYLATYGALAAEPDTDAILSIHITGQLSGTYSGAVVAAGQLPARPPVVAFDSLSGSAGLGYMVLEAAHMAEAGASVDAILARLEALRTRMRVFFALDNLRFAQMSGRVGMVRALLVSLLNVKPLLTVRDGQLALHKRVRSRALGLQSLVDLMGEALTGAPSKVAMIHAQAPETAEQLRQMLVARLPNAEMIVRELSIGIAVHFGPGTVGVIGYQP
jgi:DegV family protein with EDD domain